MQTLMRNVLVLAFVALVQFGTHLEMKHMPVVGRLLQKALGMAIINAAIAEDCHDNRNAELH